MIAKRTHKQCAVPSLFLDLLDTTVYTDTTRQLATMQELIHGSVLALRAYILGDAVRFMPPIPGKPNGGRPRIAGYRLFSRSAGPTDFWETARRISEARKNCTHMVG